MLSEQVDIPYVEIQSEMFDEELVNKYPREILVTHSILPLYATDDMVYIALGDPTNSDAIECIKNYESRKIVISGAAPKNIQSLLNKFFAEKKPPGIPVDGELNLTITSKDATIKMVDDKGKIHLNRGPITMNVRFRKTKGEKE
jgi:hypothetical protein